MKRSDKNILILCESNIFDDSNDAAFKEVEGQYNVLKTFTLKEYNTILSQNSIDCVLVCPSFENKGFVTSIIKNFSSLPHIALIKKGMKKMHKHF
ncbi:MAG: hypothetical protein HQ471_01950 [Flavobacteriales bacterium]|jgi:hypothetical protein|nr:hypothetical protein [Flavobacteriales bacterium]